MTTSAKITDIIYESGFTCTTQFYTLFKAKTGMNPAQYRRQELATSRSTPDA